MPKSNSPISNPRGVKNVLVERFSALGDVAMTIPVVYSACRCYPDVRFVLLTKPSMGPIFINKPDNLEVVTADVTSQYKGFSGLRRLFGELRATYQIDGIIDLHDVLRTKVVCLLGRLRRIPVATINKGRKGKRALTRRHNKVLLPLISSRARYRQAFHRLGLPVQERFDGLFGRGGKGDPAIFAEITPPKTPGEKWVGIAPFAKHAGKIYPLEQMETVVAELAADPSVRLFFFGGGDEERKILSEWAKKYPRAISLAEKRYGFPMELALTSHLDVMVSMDSANMHLASLVGTPVVSVWGATHPYCGFKGWRQQESDMVQLPMTCRPCSVFGNKPCFRGDSLCLRGIHPQMILEKVRLHLR